MARRAGNSIRGCREVAGRIREGAGIRGRGSANEHYRNIRRKSSIMQDAWQSRGRRAGSASRHPCAIRSGAGIDTPIRRERGHHTRTRSVPERHHPNARDAVRADAGGRDHHSAADDDLLVAGLRVLTASSPQARRVALRSTRPALAALAGRGEVQHELRIRPAHPCEEGTRIRRGPGRPFLRKAASIRRFRTSRG